MVDKIWDELKSEAVGVMFTPDRVFMNGAQAPGRGQHYPLASRMDAILPSYYP